jgi:hypothetical protein
MAREWSEVPEYVASLETTLGADGAPAFLAAIETAADEMRSAGRGLFERWLDRVALQGEKASTQAASGTSG